MANFPYPNNTVDSIVGLIQYDNQITNGLFGLVVLIGFFMISVLSLKTFEMSKAFTAASFFTAVMGFLLRMMEVLPDRYLWAPFLFIALGLVFIKFEG